MRDSPLALPNLAPPPGGLARLRQSVETPRRSRVAWGGFAVAGCAVVALMLAVFPGLLQRHRTHAALVQAVQRAVQPAEPGQVRMIQGAVLVLESGQPGVRLYLVQPTLADEVQRQR